MQSEDIEDMSKQLQQHAKAKSSEKKTTPKEKKPELRKITMENRSLSTERQRENYPGPGFYQINYANVINGPKIRCFILLSILRQFFKNLFVLKYRFAGSLREDFYALGDKNKLGPGSFEIIREFDHPAKEKRTIEERNILNFSNSQASVNRVPKIISPGPGLYNPEKILSKIAIKYSYFIFCE